MGNVLGQTVLQLRCKSSSFTKTFSFTNNLFSKCFLQCIETSQTLERKGHNCSFLTL